MNYTITYTDDINNRMLDLFRAAVQELSNDYTIERIADAARAARSVHIECICSINNRMPKAVVGELRNGGSAAFRAAFHADMAIRMLTAMKMAEIDGVDNPTVGKIIAPYMDFLDLHIAFHFYEDDDDADAVPNPKPDASGDAVNPHTAPQRITP